MKVWFPAIKASSGADVFVKRLSAALRKRDVETEITWFNKYYEFVPFLLGKTNVPAGVDIIHVNSWNGFAFKRPGIPLVVTEHHCVFDPCYRPYKNFFQYLYHEIVIKKYAIASFRKSAAVTAVSSFTRNSLALFAKTEDARLIYNWVDIDKFKPHNKENIKEQSGPFRLLFVGNTSRRKGFDLLLPIMKRLGKEFELRFTTGLRDVVKYNYPENMIPLGRLSEDDLVNEYQECDALLFPTRFEGFGYAALEAMACGKPVIASGASSIPEVVQDGVTGILCPVDDIEAFVSACHKLAAEPDMYQRVCEAGRNRAVEMFSEDLIIGQYIALYKSLLAV